jgi:hypothetical protein
MQRVRIVVGVLAVSFLLAGCDGGDSGTTTAPPDEAKAAASAALQKARPGPTGKGGAPATSPASK